MTGVRTPSAIDRVADEHLDRLCALDPLLATEIGVTGHDDRLTRFDPESDAEHAEELRRALRRLGDEPPVDAVDIATVTTMRSALGADLALAAAGERLGAVDVLASPVQAVRDCFSLMDPVSAVEQIRARLADVPAALASYRAGLDARVAAGPPLARRQPLLVAAQAREATDAIRRSLGPAFADADLTDVARAFAATADHLERVVAPACVTDDAIGDERYRRFSRSFVGATVDLHDAYAWGLDQVAEIAAEQRALATELTGSGDVAAAVAVLDADPRYLVHGTDALQAWMQDLCDRVVADLAGRAFDIPDELRRLACRISPSGTGGIYYTAPSEDLARPGTMWWAVPPGTETFRTWQETTTVYHEGVPGHHLQIGQAMIDGDLNRWRKLASFTSGHGEGWALYAERLMGELGWLSDPGDRMGMLDGQRLRAARVVIDIGVHLRLPAPASVGGGVWDADKAWEYLTANVAMDREFLRFELDRYLGWPGQAPSYALGRRVWERTRDGYLAAHPAATLRDFHSAALRLGGVTLEALETLLIP